MSAVLVTGQLRSLEKTLPHIIEHLVLPNNGCLFVCCETDNPDHLTRILPTNVGGILCAPTFRDHHFQSIMNMIKSSNRAGLTEEVFDRSRKADGIHWTLDYIERSGSVLQYYQFWRLWQLVLEYERKNNVKFNHCIRTRTDVMISVPLRVDSVLQQDHIQQLIHEDKLVKTSRYYDDFTTTMTENTVVTLGHEQVWFGNRSVFDRLSQLIFHYGLWDSGFPFAFNSESAFHQFCKHYNIYHIGIEEKGWPLYTYSYEESQRWLFSIVKF